MDNESVKAFNSALSSIYTSKLPLSKHKIEEITKAALKGKTYYKHVVFSVEKFLGKCKPEYKLPVLYIIDSIIRVSKRQFKEKDVYGPRFLKNMFKTLEDLLDCPEQDQYRVVRTLNLWGTGGIYNQEEVEPLKQFCRNQGLETDIEMVERKVKGDKANLSIYGEFAPKPAQAELYEARTPPGHPGFPGQALPEAKKELPSDEIPEAGISEKQFLELMQKCNVDFGGTFSSDISLLRKAHAIVNGELLKREDQRKLQHSHSLSKMLRMEFDYSDEEDEDAQRPEPPLPPPPSIEQRLELAVSLILDPEVTNAFRHLQQEFVQKLNKVAAAAISHTQQQQSEQIAALTSVPPPNVSQPSQLPPGLPPNVAAELLQRGLPVSLPGGLPGLPGLPQGLQLPPGLQGLAGLPGLPLANVGGLPGLPPGLNHAQIAQNAALLQMLNPLAVPGLLGQAPPNLLPNQGPPDLIKQQQELLKHLQQQQAAGGPPPEFAGLLGVPPGQLPLMNIPPPHFPGRDEDFRGDMDNRGTKRSRSKDRGEKRRRSRSRERERDKKERERDRERRKLGLPSIIDGVAYICSRTLWFGRLPNNCTDADIKSSVATAGEVIRISIIASKACAYVTMDSRKNAFEVVNRMSKDMKVKDKSVKVNWALSTGLKELQNKGVGNWDESKGVTSLRWDEMPSDLEKFCDGGFLDIPSLPAMKQAIYTETGAIAVAPPPTLPSNAGGDDHHMDMSPHEASPEPESSFSSQPDMGNLPYGLPMIPQEGMPISTIGGHIPHHMLPIHHMGTPRGGHMPMTPHGRQDFGTPGSGPPFRGRGGFRGDRGGFGRGGFGRGGGGFGGPGRGGGYGGRGGFHNDRQPFNRENGHGRFEDRGDQRRRDRVFGGRDRDFGRDRGPPNYDGDRGRAGPPPARWQERRDDERPYERRREDRPEGRREERPEGRRSRWGDEHDRERRDQDVHERRRSRSRSRERSRIERDHSLPPGVEPEERPRRSHKDARPTPDASLVSSTTEDHMGVEAEAPPQHQEQPEKVVEESFQSHAVPPVEDVCMESIDMPPPQDPAAEDSAPQTAE